MLAFGKGKLPTKLSTSTGKIVWAQCEENDCSHGGASLVYTLDSVL